jgi:negative regulator of flagellin synthesis FlgM
MLHNYPAASSTIDSPHSGTSPRSASITVRAAVRLRQIRQRPSISPVKPIVTGTDAVKQTNNGGSTATVQPQSDATSLTTAGGLLTQALSGDDTRAGKVQALQQAIAAGTYNVSSSAVADKLIESMLG